MANEPEQSKEKRTSPAQRQNTHGDHEGSGHTPSEFDVTNPEKQGISLEKPAKKIIKPL